MIGDPNYCFICGTTQNLEEHHCIGGSYRNTTDRMGMTVMVCSNCHTQNPDSIHREPSGKTKKMLQKVGQIWAMEHYNMTTDDFIKFVGKNFL